VTIDEAIERAAEKLRTAGVSTPDLDAELLLRHVLGFDRARIIAESRLPLSFEAEEHFASLVDARAARRPLQHLVGTQAFWKHEFLVTPDVLIPRPETELVVEESLRLLAGHDRPVVVDVGTGSGCIALSLAAERPDAEVHAIDRSPAALAVARINADRLGLSARVAFHEGDLLAPLRPRVTGLDLIVSNPPYAAPADRHTLAPEVRDHEPPMALFPPDDAYSIYRRLVPEAFVALRPRGGLVLEIGLGMDQEVIAIVAAAGFAVDAVRPDLQGIPRTVVARARPG
jgi:release factor glutamine methyltransferase